MSLQSLEISEEFQKKYYKQVNLDGKFKLKDSREDPVHFSTFMIGFKPRDYQAYFLDRILNNQQVIAVKGRQIGFSTTLAMLCAWAIWFNKFPAGAKGVTEITVISKDDDAAKELLQKVKDFFYMGDRTMSKILKGTQMHTQQLFSKEFDTNNMDLLKLKNGCIIRSFPPTGKIRGTSNSIVILDEFAFLNSNDIEKFYYTDVLPTISETRGKIVISSTPNGYGDLFQKLVDPEDKMPKHEFERIMLPFTINKNNAGYTEMVKSLKDHMEPSKFSQEYMCDFTQSDTSFFISKKVQEMFDESVLDLDLDRHEYVASVDYGMTESRSVITLCTKIDDIIYRTYYKEFESGWDINGVIPFMTGLMDRFKIVKIVVDHCPQGDAVNKRMIELGWNVELFDFHTRKIETYCSFRNKMNKGEIKMAYDSQTELQFLEMVEEESKTGKLMVHKRRHGRDDICDSMIMAASKFLETKETIGCYFV